MRIASPGCLFAQPLLEQVVRQALELVVLTVEVGLIDGEGIDELLDLAVSVGAQASEIARKGRRVGGGHALPDAPLDVIALGLGEYHSGASVEIFAERSKLVFGEAWALSHECLRPRCGPWRA